LGFVKLHHLRQFANNGGVSAQFVNSHAVAPCVVKVCANKDRMALNIALSRVGHNSI